MMVKLTIITWILAFIARYLVKVSVNLWSPSEKIAFAVDDNYMPKYSRIIAYIYGTLIVVAVVLTIVTVVTWK